MPRTITVKGMGNVKTAPDYVVVSMSLDAQGIRCTRGARGKRKP